LKEIISSVKGFQILGPANTTMACDLLIYELGDDLRREFRSIDDLKESGKVKEFFLTSPKSEPEILIQALRGGAREFLSQPIKKEEVRHGLIRFLGQKRDEDRD
jgi:pilus assembly protein CpaE